MRLFTLCTALVLTALTTAPARAETKDTGWKTVEAGKLEDLVLDEANVRLNNLLFKEGDSVLSGDRAGVRFTCQARNKGTRPVRVSVQLAALDKDGTVLFVLSNDIRAEDVAAGEMTELYANLRLPRGELAKAKSYKYRVIIDRE